MALEKNSRTGKSIRNIYYIFAYQLINVVCSFATRRVMVMTLGIEAVALKGLFTEVIAMLSLAEMGVGTAITYNLYKPLAENDEKKVAQLMDLFKKAYNVIAAVILVVGLVLTPWIQYLITDIDYPLSYIRFIYILYVLQTATSYLFVYKTTLLNADQKNYIVSAITAVVKVLSTIVLIALMLLTHNFVVYLIGLILFGLSTNVTASIYMDRHYPYLGTGDSLPKEERKQVFSNIRNIFIKSLSSRITHSTDNILISTLVSTLMVGYYNNYATLINLAASIATQGISGASGSLGNLSVSSSNEQCNRVLKRLTFLFYLYGSVVGISFFACASPLIELWLGKEYILNQGIVFTCSLVIFLESACQPLWVMMTVSGLFRPEKYTCIMGCVVNLIVSIVLGQRYGIIGIFIGTVCTYVIQIVTKLYVLCHYKLKKCLKEQYLLWTKYCLIHLSLIAVMHFFICSLHIESALTKLLLYGILAVALCCIANILFFLHSDELNYSLGLARQLLSRKGKKSSRRR